MKVKVTNGWSEPRQFQRSVEDVGPAVRTVGPGETIEVDLGESADAAAAHKFADHLRSYEWDVEWDADDAKKKGAAK